MIVRTPIGQAAAGSRLMNSQAQLKASYQALVRRLLTQAKGEANRGGVIIGVVASAAGEGASTVAANLAACGATVCESPVLLVDAALERPAVAKSFGLENSCGLWDVCQGSARLEECVHATETSNLSIVVAGKDRWCSDSLLQRSRLEVLQRKFRESYDLVVMDLPPANQLGACQLLAEMADGVVLVLEAEKTRIPVVRSRKEQLEGANIRVLGVVLNKRQYHIPRWLYSRL